MDVADIPTKQDLVRAGKFARVFDPLFDFAAAEFNALRDGILALRRIVGTGDPTRAVVAASITTTDATPTIALTYTPPDNTAMQVQLRGVIVAPAHPYAGGGTESCTAGKLGGGVSIIGAPYASGGSSDSALGAVRVDFVAQDGDLAVRVTGIAATTIKWRVVLDVVLCPLG